MDTFVAIFCNFACSMLDGSPYFVHGGFRRHASAAAALPWQRDTSSMQRYSLAIPKRGEFRETSSFFDSYSCEQRRRAGNADRTRKTGCEQLVDRLRFLRFEKTQRAKAD